MRCLECRQEFRYLSMDLKCQTCEARASAKGLGLVMAVWLVLVITGLCAWWAKRANATEGINAGASAAFMCSMSPCRSSAQCGADCVCIIPPGAISGECYGVPE